MRNRRKLLLFLPAVLLLAGRGGGRSMTYPIDPRRPYGDRWRRTRPPGLPAWAPQASTAGYAVPLVRAEAARYGLGPAFVEVLAELAMGESGGRLYLPARNFDARPEAENPITAFGWDQANKGYWSRWKGTSPRPVWRWTMTLAEEVARPVEHYAVLWQEAKALRLNDRDAGRYLRLHHATPGQPYQDLVEALESGDTFAAAWNRVNPDRRRIIDGHLDDAGL